MKKILSTFLIYFAVILFAFPQDRPTIKIEVPEGPVPWSNLNINNNPATFQFAIVTDRTGGHRPGVFLDGVQKLNLLQPEFVMSVGDLIEGYTEDTSRLNWEWREFNGFIDSLDVPFFYVPGNHDITNKIMEEKWEELFGRTYYHFLYKNVLFLCLNSEDNYRGAGRGTIDNKQYDYVKKVLKENEKVKWTLVFMHQPLWNQKDTKRWKDVEKLLENRRHTVFVGHNHRYRKYDRNNGKYFILATTGGGSALRGPNFGEFDHVVWVTMTDDGPILANLLLEGIWHEDVMTEDFADFILPIANNLPMHIEPIFIDGADFGNAKAKLKISNPTNYNLNLEYRFMSNKNLLVNPTSFREVVDPNDVKFLDVAIQGINIKSLNEIDNLCMEINLKYDIEGRPGVELEKTYNIRPTIKHSAKMVSKPVKIDGNIKEWGNMDFELVDHAIVVADPFSHRGADDGSAVFSVRYDEKNIYVAANIIDDEIFVEDGNPLYQDAAVILFDARPVLESGMNHGQNLFRDWIVLAVSPDDEGTVFRKQRLPKGTKCVVKKTTKGYAMEAAIPVSYLHEKQSRAWQTFRFNFMVNDYDQSGNHHAKISWEPLWNEKDNYIGSGTFFK